MLACCYDIRAMVNCGGFAKVSAWTLTLGFAFGTICLIASRVLDANGGVISPHTLRTTT